MAIAPGVHASNASASTASLATAGVATQATGSTFVIGVGWGSAAFTSVADNKGNTYSIIDAEISASAHKTRLYYCENGVGGAGHTSTLTLGSADACTIFFLEITGGLTASILDQHIGRDDTTSPYTLAVGLTTTQDDELLVAFLFGDSGSNPATHAESGLGSSTIQEDVTNGTTFWTGCMATQVVAATAAYNPSWTESGATDSHVWLATFKASLVSANIYYTKG